MKTEIDLRPILAVIVTFGAIVCLIQLTPALIHMSQGNVANATDIIVDVTIDELVNSVEWVIALAFLSFLGSVLAIVGIKMKT